MLSAESGIIPVHFQVLPHKKRDSRDWDSFLESGKYTWRRQVQGRALKDAEDEKHHG